MSDYLNSTRRSVAWLKAAHDKGQLEIKPPFQRNPVWTDAQKSFLVDSILQGYPIPELYMQESVSPDGVEHYTVVDGQQRVRACLEFIEGAFDLDPDQASQWPDMKFEDLTPEERTRFFAYNFLVRQLPPVPDEQLRVVFQRLNRNTVALNRQELRHATYWGQFIKSMEGIAELPWWSVSGIFTPNDFRRMLDIEFISEIAVAYLHGLQNKKSTLDKWYATYEREYADRARVEEAFQSTMGEISQVLPDIPSTRWRKKSDFYSLFLAFAAHSSKLPLTKNGRKQAGDVLRKFGSDVDAYLSGDHPKASKAVIKYADAVERAASDLANRRARAEVLNELLAPVFT